MNVLTLDPDAPWRRLRWELEHGPVYKRGVSEDALKDIAEDIAVLCETAPRDILESRAHKALIRRLVLLLPDTPRTDLDRRVHEIINHPGLTVQDVRGILEVVPEREVHSWDLYLAGQWLRNGATAAHVASNLGVSPDLVGFWVKWMGLREARDEALRSQAFAFLDRGEPAHVFAAETGVSTQKAREALRAVRAELDEKYG